MTYPLGVLAAGLEGVFDARPGTSGPLTKALPANLPAGCAIDSGLEWLYAAAPFAETDFDFSDYQCYFNGGAFSVDNFRFADLDNTLYQVAVGHENGGVSAASLTLSNGVLDQIHNTAGKNTVVVAAGSSLTLDNVSFLNTSNKGLFASDSTTLTDVYMEAPGQTYGGGHVENEFLRNGVHSRTRVFYDARQSAGIDGEFTAQVYVAPDTAGLTSRLTLDDFIFAGADGLGVVSRCPSAIAVGGSGPGATAILTLGRGVIKPGSAGGAAGYIKNHANVGASVTVTVNGPVYDYSSGDNITAMLQAAFPSSTVTSSGAMTLSMISAGTVNAGPTASGAMTLQMGMSGTAEYHGSITASGAMSLTMGMAGQASHNFGDGAMVLTMSMAGTLSHTGAASADGAMFLQMGMAGDVAVGVSASGAMTLEMMMAGAANASGSVAKVRNSNARVAPPRNGGRTVTAA